MQQLGVPPGDKWTAAIIITKQGLKPEAQVFSLVFIKQGSYQSTAIMTVKDTTAAKKKKNYIIKVKTFGVQLHHTTYSTKSRIEQLHS